MRIPKHRWRVCFPRRAGRLGELIVHGPRVAAFPARLLLGCLCLALPLRAADPTFSLDTSYINFSTPTESTLDDGYQEKDSQTSSYAVKITVDGGDTGKGWTVYVTAADDLFTPGGVSKPCGDLKWKKDGESANSYRILTTTDEEVESHPEGGSATIKLDLKMLVDWSDPPASYGLDLTVTMIVDP